MYALTMNDSTMYKSADTTMYDATMYEIRPSGHVAP